MEFRRIYRQPPDMAGLIDEAAEGLGGLYGPAAAEDYRAKAPRMWAMHLAHAQVRVFAALDGPWLAALLLAVCRPPALEIPFLHVRAPYRGRGVEAALLRAVLPELIAPPIACCVAECVPLAPLDVHAAFLEAGFAAVPRTLMIAPLDAPALAAAPQDPTRAMRDADWAAAGACLCAAYADAPGRALHREALDAAAAGEFLQRARAGGYGPAHATYLRVLPEDRACSGMIAGCEAAPGVGFVLQVAVRPDRRGRGHGTALVRALAAAFRARGLERIALGVTLANPAHRLYAALGFAPLRAVTAYHWPYGGPGAAGLDRAAGSE